MDYIQIPKSHARALVIGIIAIGILSTITAVSAVMVSTKLYDCRQSLYTPSSSAPLSKEGFFKRRKYGSKLS